MFNFNTIAQLVSEIGGVTKFGGGDPCPLDTQSPMGENFVHADRQGSGPLHTHHRVQFQRRRSASFRDRSPKIWGLETPFRGHWEVQKWILGKPHVQLSF